MNDALNFIPAEEYFAQSHTWGGPKSVIKVTTTPPADAKYKAYWHGANITFDDGSLCVVQYVRPTLFRIRYDPTRRGVRGANAADEYTDVNTWVFPRSKYNTERESWLDVDVETGTPSQWTL